MSELRAAAEAVRLGATPLPLSTFLRDWERWSVDADRSEDGWQTDYPQIGELVVIAEGLMIGPTLEEGTLRDLDLCWAITEEDELLAEFAHEQLDRCWSALRWLIACGHKDTRWQIAAVLEDATDNPEAEVLLRAALDDPDTYVCRRALVSLARFTPPDVRELAERFLRDPDPYLRQVAIETKSTWFAALRVQVSPELGFRRPCLACAASGTGYWLSCDSEDIRR